MTETPNAIPIVVIASCAVLWGLFGGRLERRWLTGPIAFVVAGVVLANGPFAVARIEVGNEAVRILAELALALVLFGDAATLDVGQLRKDIGVPTRLLGVAMPLCVVAGTLAAVWLLGPGDWWVGAVIGASLAPTDAALGSGVMNDPAIPRRVRRTLNVESGLNDGIATPMVDFFLAGALAATYGGSDMVDAVQSILGGAALGALIGYVGAWSLERAGRREWTEVSFEPMLVGALSIGTYFTAVALDANGFVAAFVAGLGFAAARVSRREERLLVTEDSGNLLSLVVWFIFGASMLLPAIRTMTWRELAFAALALTVIRMVPVAVSLIGTGMSRPTVAFIGWFGPRGLASIVFALVAFDALDDTDGGTVLHVVTLTVALSVVAHGVTAIPLSKRFSNESHLGATSTP